MAECHGVVLQILRQNSGQQNAVPACIAMLNSCRESLADATGLLAKDASQAAHHIERALTIVKQYAADALTSQSYP